MKTSSSLGPKWQRNAHIQISSISHTFKIALPLISLIPGEDRDIIIFSLRQYFFSQREGGREWEGEGRSQREREQFAWLVIRIFAEQSSGRRCAGSWLHRERKAMVAIGIARADMLQSGARGSWRGCFWQVAGSSSTSPGNHKLCSAWLSSVTSWEPAALCTWLCNPQLSFSCLMEVSPSGSKSGY